MTRPMTSASADITASGSNADPRDIRPRLHGFHSGPGSPNAPALPQSRRAPAVMSAFAICSCEAVSPQPTQLRTLLKTIKANKFWAVLRQNLQARAMFLKAFAAVLISIILSICSLQIQPSTSETAEYGNMGSDAENWQPRLVAGWPAPFIADIPTISVPRQIGLEDEFRSSAFLATFSFWLLMTTVVIVTFCSFRRR